MIKKLFRNTSHGQAIVLVAIAFVGLAAMAGLLIDGGKLLIEYARLKRGVDAAAIGAAQQFRKNFTNTDLVNAATEFLQLNQSDVFNVEADTCDTVKATNPDDPLCAVPLRKLVRITASRHVTFGFLPIVGINSTDITATSVGEAASVDLIMVVDTSISMAAATSGNPNTIDPGDDPTTCNPNNTCEPMADVKAVAQAFADKLFYPYDRVGVIALTSQVAGGGRDPVMVWPLQSSGDGPTDQANVDSAIQSLKVFQPRTCIQPLSSDTNPGPCLNYPDGVDFAGQECPKYRNTNPNDPTTCNSTNAGAALIDAGSEFADPDTERKDSFWAVVLILSGTPNSSSPWAGDSSHPNGYCPDYGNLWTGPLCIQPRLSWNIYPPNDNSTRHGNGDSHYTSLDYALDAADYVTGPAAGAVVGQGASIYSIGLGNRVENSSTYGGTADANEAEEYLEYAAEYSGGLSANHGNYYYAPTTSTLSGIFDDIYKNITTRISE
ncbi:MAG TPA: hypothetical protein VLX61_05545 [Anaerolineales bacterium]|nr:hypothetical protein [Anaerolineales bacterium]